MTNIHLHLGRGEGDVLRKAGELLAEMQPDTSAEGIQSFVESLLRASRLVQRGYVTGRPGNDL